MKETICTVAGLVGGFIATLQPTSYRGEYQFKKADFLGISSL